MSDSRAIEAARWVLESQDRAWMMRRYRDLAKRIDDWSDYDYSDADEWLVAEYLKAAS